MKNLKFLLTAFILSGVISCKKPNLTTTNISIDDAASMLGGSLSSNSYGVNNISSDVSLNGQTFIANSQPCGSTLTDTLSRQATAGSAVMYGYKLIYTHKLFCNSNNQPDNITSSLIFSGYYNGPKVSITNSGTVGFVLAGLTPTATVYSLNGEYKSMGSFKLKADTTNNGTANVDIVAKNVTISKSTRIIASGTATVIITGTTTKKGGFTYNGTLTFNGNSMATMVVNGVTYTVNLLTGDVVRK